MARIRSLKYAILDQHFIETRIEARSSRQSGGIIMWLPRQKSAPWPRSKISSANSQLLHSVDVSTEYQQKRLSIFTAGEFTQECSRTQPQPPIGTTCSSSSIRALSCKKPSRRPLSHHKQPPEFQSNSALHNVFLQVLSVFE